MPNKKNVPLAPPPPLSPMRVLVACEYSGRVRDAFLKRGHDAISCDLLPSDAPNRPHYQGDVLDIINDGFDLMIAHPPCTYLTISAEWAYRDVPMINGKPKNIKKGTLIGSERREAREMAIEFFRKLWESGIPRIAIENPVGVVSKRLPFLPKPQYIQPYEYGHDASKRTGLWLKNLAPLLPTKKIEPRIVGNGLLRWGNQTDSGQNKLPPTNDRWKIRSTTYQGIADAMATQWGGFDNDK